MSDDINLITAKMSEIMLKSEYDKVIFHDIAESYPTDSDIQCQYSLTENVVPAEGDLVALFKVGWDAPHLYLQAEKASLPEEHEVTANHCVMFKAENLPKDDETFYQFCYISADGIVRGASTPYRFRAPTTDELVEVEDADSDLLVIRSRTAVIEEKLWEMAVKNRELLTCKTHLEKELKQDKSQLNEAEEKLLACKEEMKRTKEQHDKALAEHNQRWQDAFDTEQKRAADELTFLKNQMTQNEAYIEELRTTIKLLTAENEKLASKLNHTKQQIEALQKEAETSNVHLQTLSGKNEELLQTIATSQSDIHKLQQKNHTLELELCTEQKKYAELKKKESLMEQETHELACRLIDTEHMLTAMEKSKHMATEELMAHSEFKNKLTKQLEETESEVHILQILNNHRTDENEGMHVQMDRLNAEYEELKEKYEDAKKELEKYAVLNKQWEEEKANYVTLMEDLKQRLQAGAVEYQAKYIECLKLEKKLGKLKKRIKEKLPHDNLNHSSEGETATQDSASQCEGVELPSAKISNKVKSSAIDHESMLASKDVIIERLQQQLDAVTNAFRNLPGGCFLFTNGSYQPPHQVLPGYSQWMPNVGFGSTAVCPTPQATGSQNVEQSTSTAAGSASSTSVATTVQPTANSDHLPPPIQPEITALAKLAAITAVTKHFTENQIPVPNPDVQIDTTVPPEHDVDVEVDGPVQLTAPEPPTFIPAVNKCPVCNTVFADLSSLQEHIEIHFVRNCPVCNQQFGSDQDVALQEHVNAHFDQDPSVQRYSLSFD